MSIVLVTEYQHTNKIPTITMEQRCACCLHATDSSTCTLRSTTITGNRPTNEQCCCQGLEVRGQVQGQGGLKARGQGLVAQGQGLSPRTRTCKFVLEDPRGRRLSSRITTLEMNSQTDRV